MGHGRCGGCHAALTQSFKGARPGEGGFIAHWIDLLDEARERVVAEHGEANERPALRAMEHETVKVSLANLRTFPCIREREAAGRLTLHGAWFAIASGELHLLDQATGAFAPACPFSRETVHMASEPAPTSNLARSDDRRVGSECDLTCISP